MAKVTSGNLYLRKTITQNGSSMVEESIDLSSFVNLPQGECLRIKQVWFEWTTDNFGTINGTDIGASGAAQGASISGQITTTSRAALGVVSFESAGCVAKNNLYAHIDATANIDMITHDSVLNPYEFSDGYIVAVDTLYFGCKGSTVDLWADDLNMTCLIECETVKLSEKDAIALAVGQTL